MKNKKTLWKWWSLALGEKSSKCDKEADRVSIIRTFMFLSIFITNSFIVYGVLKSHHFPKEPQSVHCIIVDK